ncbi:tol-pal system YbgF family protein [Flavobacterium sp. J27]|uniref:tetratricopeptide repeat protein n=1 Tax=Flavobacterium sp. J27 TaxID=2060419 RepID=UPI00102F6EC0|nr:hypothetical protein [Flavobacterium sp. J27]
MTIFDCFENNIALQKRKPVTAQKTGRLRKAKRVGKYLNNIKMGLFNALFGKKKSTLQDLDEKNDDFIAKNPIAQNDENEMMRNASKLMTSGKFSESLDLYKKLSENYPNNKGLYESQIGVAYHFLGDYENAVAYYISSLNNGGDKSMMDDNIWEAAEAFSKLESQEKGSSTTNTTKLIEKYWELFPNGRYAKKAKKHLGK